MSNKIEDILSKNELVNYVAGFPEYRIPAPGLIPTNPEIVFNSLKDRIESNKPFRLKFLNALKEVARMPEYCWFSLYYLFDLHSFQRKTKITLITPDLINVFAESLREHKPALELSREWEGRDWPNGLWGEVQRLNENIEESMGITVLPEEL